MGLRLAALPPQVLPQGGGVRLRLVDDPAGADLCFDQQVADLDAVALRQPVGEIGHFGRKDAVFCRLGPEVFFQYIFLHLQFGVQRLLGRELVLQLLRPLAQGGRLFLRRLPAGPEVFQVAAQLGDRIRLVAAFVPQPALALPEGGRLRLQGGGLLPVALLHLLKIVHHIGLVEPADDCFFKPFS